MCHLELSGECSYGSMLNLYGVGPLCRQLSGDVCFEFYIENQVKGHIHLDKLVMGYAYVINDPKGKPSTKYDISRSLGTHQSQDSRL